jgi:L-serine dehydratase
MKDYTIFDIIGPIMIGPSSSHTAGTCRIGYSARKIVKEKIKKVEFVLFESFAKTYKGHGTDIALLGGILGMKPDDENIVKSFTKAKEYGIDYKFTPVDDEANHPNTVLMIIETVSGIIWNIVGQSLGGGRMMITKINDIDVEFSGEYHTLITHHNDSPGILMGITTILSNHKINIAFMKLFREQKGMEAIGVFEADEEIDKGVIDELKLLKGIKLVNVIDKI